MSTEVRRVLPRGHDASTWTITLSMTRYSGRISCFVVLCVLLGGAAAVLTLPRAAGALALLGGALALTLAVDVPYFIGLALHTLLPVRLSCDNAADISRWTSASRVVSAADLDRNAHMNNARYARECGFGRMSHFSAMGLWRALERFDANIVIAAQTMRYRRELGFAQCYELRTRIAGWHERSFFLEQRFVVGGFVHAQLFAEYRVVRRRSTSSARGGATVSSADRATPTPAMLLAATRGGGEVHASPKLSPAIAAWVECNHASSAALRAESGLGAR